MISTADAFEFPRVNVQNFQSLGQNTFTDLLIAPTTHSFNVNATKVWGAHTMKMGSDYRKFLLNFTQLFFPSGQFAFNNAQWTQRNPNVTSGTQGAALASMLLGIPSGVNLSHNPSPASSQLVLVGLRAGRLEARAQPDGQPRAALRIRRAAHRALQSPELLRSRSAVAARGRRAGATRSSIRRSSRARWCSWTTTTAARWTPTTTTSARASGWPGIVADKTVIRSG